jgi:hypothetical protein
MTAAAPSYPDPPRWGPTTTSQVDPDPPDGGDGGDGVVWIGCCGICKRRRKGGGVGGGKISWFRRLLNYLKKSCCSGSDGSDGDSVVRDANATRMTVDPGQPGPGMKRTIVGGYVVWRPT